MAAEHMRDDVVGFRAQQAVEKALKVALVLANVDLPRSHDLRELVDIAADNDIAVPGSIEQAHWLTPWAAQLRYEMLELLDRDAAFSPPMPSRGQPRCFQADWRVRTPIDAFKTKLRFAHAQNTHVRSLSRFGFTKPRAVEITKTGRSGRVANRETQLNTLVQLLMEPAGRQARRRAAEAIHKRAAN